MLPIQASSMSALYANLPDEIKVLCAFCGLLSNSAYQGLLQVSQQEGFIASCGEPAQHAQHMQSMQNMLPRYRS